jgi:phosphate transport system substrate-binding protein
MSKRLICALSLILAIGTVTGCGNSTRQTPEPATLRISGSSSMAPALNALSVAYTERNPQAIVQVLGGGSSIGLQELQTGEVEIAALSWQSDDQPISDSFQYVTIARDAIAIIVHPKNNVSGLTTLQLRAIYRGEILDWTTLGGPAAEPLVISREDGSGTRAGFEAMVMGGDRVTLNALVMPSSQAMIDYVATHPRAIGYVSMASLTEDVRTVAIEETTPNQHNTRSGAYHLTRELHLVTPKPMPVQTREFLDFVLGQAGQSILETYHVALR